MCGIVGRVNFSRKKKDWNIKRFQSALNLIKHRGPDSEGIYQNSSVILGHRRLSIIDLDKHSNQPMISNCRNFILVFNGEIYNYKEIRERLKNLGYRFRTDSDTEVLLNAFIEDGLNSLDYLIGMFSFAIYDIKNEKIFIIRDRLGIKPLYYTFNGEEFIFASEIKSILQLLNSTPRINENAISSYLSFRYPILNETFFKNIYSLEPAHYIEITKNKISTVKYWNLEDRFNLQREDKGEKFYIEKLEELLVSSVKYRMISDVPFGAFLSGGVDSSIITYIMSQLSNKPIKTFTIGFKEEGFNEFNYSQLVADVAKTEHHQIILSSKNYIKELGNLIFYKDAPLSVPNEVPLYLMSKELKKYITVVLSGEGADELFGGYGRIFRSYYDYERLKNIDRLNFSKDEEMLFKNNFISKYSTLKFKNRLEHFLHLYSYTPFNKKKLLLNPDLNIDSIENRLKDKFQAIFDSISKESYYNKTMLVFIKVHLVGLLHRVDTTTMATSVEARVPFVDHRLVEFSASLPFKYKLRWKSKDSKKLSKLLMSDKISELYDIPKYLLKKSYEKHLPKKILYRKKVGFPVPLDSWFGGELNSYAKEILLSKEARERGVYNNKYLERLLTSKNDIRDNKIGMKIWMLVNLEIFFKKYFDKTF